MDLLAIPTNVKCRDDPIGTTSRTTLPLEGFGDASVRWARPLSSMASVAQEGTASQAR